MQIKNSELKHKISLLPSSAKQVFLNQGSVKYISEDCQVFIGDSYEREMVCVPKKALLDAIRFMGEDLEFTKVNSHVATVSDSNSTVTLTAPIIPPDWSDNRGGFSYNVYLGSISNDITHCLSAKNDDRFEKMYLTIQEKQAWLMSYANSVFLMAKVEATSKVEDVFTPIPIPELLSNNMEINVGEYLISGNSGQKHVIMRKKEDKRFKDILRSHAKLVHEAKGFEDAEFDMEALKRFISMTESSNEVALSSGFMEYKSLILKPHKDGVELLTPTEYPSRTVINGTIPFTIKHQTAYLNRINNNAKLKVHSIFGIKSVFENQVRLTSGMHYEGE